MVRSSRPKIGPGMMHAAHCPRRQAGPMSSGFCPWCVAAYRRPLCCPALPPWADDAEADLWRRHDGARHEVDGQNAAPPITGRVLPLPTTRTTRGSSISTTATTIGTIRTIPGTFVVCAGSMRVRGRAWLTACGGFIEVLSCDGWVAGEDGLRSTHPTGLPGVMGCVPLTAGLHPSYGCGCGDDVR